MLPASLFDLYSPDQNAGYTPPSASTVLARTAHSGGSGERVHPDSSREQLSPTTIHRDTLTLDIMLNRLSVAHLHPHIRKTAAAHRWVFLLPELSPYDVEDVSTDFLGMRLYFACAVVIWWILFPQVRS